MSRETSPHATFARLEVNKPLRAFSKDASMALSVTYVRGRSPEEYVVLPENRWGRGAGLMQLTSLLASLNQGVHAVILDRVRRDSKSVN